MLYPKNLLLRLTTHKERERERERISSELGKLPRGGMSGNEMFEKMTKSKIGKASLNKLNKISRLKVIIGPYYDIGDAILIVNNSNFSKLKPVLKKIANMSHKKGKKHVLIGKMFGYTCPIDLNEIYNG